MKLFEIDEALMQCVDQETGEILDEEKLDSLVIEREKKIEGVALWIKNLTAEAKAMREEEKKMAERRRVEENRINSLKGWLAYALDGQKFSTTKCAVSYRKSSSVNINDLSKVDKKYLIPQEPKPDKKAIKDALKSGEKIDGCTLEEKTNVSIK